MKYLSTLALVFVCSQLFAQPSTEVYLLDITVVNGKSFLSNPRNISNNPGYDNQPSFYDDNTILFASTRNEQTDIAKYNIKTGKVSWLTNTFGGSEFSPLRIPNSKNISAIRLDTTGYQRLYEYDIATGQSKEILKDLKVGYHVWHNDTMLFTSVLIDNRMDLVANNLVDNNSTLIYKNVGRSLHNIPNSNHISYIAKSEEFSTQKSFDTDTNTHSEIIPLANSTQDIAWLKNGSMLVPNDKTIIIFNPKDSVQSSRSHQFKEKEINGITRMAVSPDGKHLAIVSEVSPEIVVQKQVEAFNTANLDAFAACYSENVVVRNFPNDTIYTGNKNLKANYKRYFKTNPKTTVQVVKRIQIGKVIIDEEIVIRSGKTHHQAAIYEVDNGKITSMTFVHEKEKLVNVEMIIEEQLNAFRKRDIEGFLNSYANNVEATLFVDNSPGFRGKEEMRTQYAIFLEQAEGLTCEIKNRIIIGNIVIDEEFISLNGTTSSAVVIYQIEEGKIVKVTFI